MHIYVILVSQYYKKLFDIVQYLYKFMIWLKKYNLNNISMQTKD